MQRAHGQEITGHVMKRRHTDFRSADRVVQRPAGVDVLLPVHNEAASIGRTVGEIFDVLSPVVPIRFIVSEDGSSDGTPDVLRELATVYPMHLVTGSERKGYSRAMLDGLAAVEAPYVLCLDGDGQCDPADFRQFWDRRDSADILIGWRVARQDSALRKLLSGSYKRLFRLLFRVGLHDPSCPFVLAPRGVVEDLSGRLGVLKQGFWWEFCARAASRGYALSELPISHRSRAAGGTQVYLLSKLPGIAWTHGLGLLQVWLESVRAGRAVAPSATAPAAGLEPSEPLSLRPA